ncbi:MAG: Cytidine deaminase [Acidobacteria bacterium]|jgi:cytidine deaminase|nr:Cytidine deaminase [Acidobacteriota bacterium]
MKLARTTVTRLIETARAAQANAHAPYSRFRVGAAVLAADGRVFAGCNVENASLGLTVCAERNAVAAAVAAGTRPVAVAVVTDQDHVGPCGACRQVLAEFGPALAVVLVGRDGTRPRTTTIERLLPGAFRFDPPPPRARRG